MSDPLTGSCLCGRIHLTLNKYRGLEICHCLDCRRFTGALSGTFLDADPPDVSIDGEGHIARFQSPADSGATLTRHWCATCGSNLYDVSSELGKIVVHGGHFPPGSLPRPAVQIFMRSKEAWEVGYGGVQALETQEGM